jgi:peroxiredoxin Q/BCP
MTNLVIGDAAPSFSLPADSEQNINLADFRGKNVVLYFYPKDDTPGCTIEAQDFRDNIEKFNDLNTVIIGISKDSVKKHDKFKEKYSLPFALVSDEEVDACQKYGVWIEKSMYGRKYMGIDRATFLIDDKGAIKNIWRKVKVKDHVEEVLAALV